LESNLTKLNSFLRELEVKADYKEIEDIYNNTVDSYLKEASVPGFRKGKAPLHMIMKLYSDSIDESFKEKAINNLAKKYFDENNIHPISYLKLLDVDYTQGKNLNFKVQFEVIPEFELTKYKGLEIEKPYIKVTDEEIEEEIERIKESESKLEVAEKALDDKYVITADVQELDPTGIPLIGKMEKDAKVKLNDQAIIEDVRKSLINCSVGDEVKVKIEADKSPSGKEINLSFIVTKVEKIVYPELDEALIKKITKDKESTLEGLKNFISNIIQSYYNNQMDIEFRNNIFSVLCDHNSLEIPETMIDNYLEDMIEDLKNHQPKKVLPPNFDSIDYKQKNRENAIFNLKAMFIRSKIIELEKITVDDVDFAEYAEKESKRFGMDKEKLLNYIKSSEDIKNNLLSKKFEQFIIENNNIIEKNLREQNNNQKIITT